MREAVHAHLDTTTRVARHERLASAIETSEEGKRRPELLVKQLEAAGDAARAATHARFAADRALEELAFDRAAQLYADAIRLGELDSATDPGLHVAHGEALANAGRPGESATAFLAAAPHVEVAERLRLEAQAGEQLLRGGRTDRGLRVVDTALKAIRERRPRSPRGLTMRMLRDRALLRLRGLGFKKRDASQISAEDKTGVDTLFSLSSALALSDFFAGIVLPEPLADGSASVWHASPGRTRPVRRGGIQLEFTIGVAHEELAVLLADTPFEIQTLSVASIDLPKKLLDRQEQLEEGLRQVEEKLDRLDEIEKRLMERPE